MYGKTTVPVIPRRNTLKAVLVGGAAFAVPSDWVTPVVDAVTLPAHAVTSEGEVPSADEPPAAPGNISWSGGVSLVASNSPQSPLNDISKQGTGLIAALRNPEKMLKQSYRIISESLIEPAQAQSVSMLLCVTANGGQLRTTGQFTISEGGQAISIYMTGAGDWDSEMVLYPDCEADLSGQFSIACTFAQGPGTAISYQLAVEGNTFAGTIPRAPCAIAGVCTFPDQG